MCSAYRARIAKAANAAKLKAIRERADVVEDDERGDDLAEPVVPGVADVVRELGLGLDVGEDQAVRLRVLLQRHNAADAAVAEEQFRC